MSSWSGQGGDSVKPSFWSRPFELSFKDVLAIAFSGTFLYFAWSALESEQALDVVKTLVPLIGVILGGYFVQETGTGVAQMWFQRSQRQEYYSTQTNSEPIAPADMPQKVNY